MEIIERDIPEMKQLLFLMDRKTKTIHEYVVVTTLLVWLEMQQMDMDEFEALN